MTSSASAQPLQHLGDVETLTVSGNGAIGTISNGKAFIWHPPY
jgi:hypothetical protein